MFAVEYDSMRPKLSPQACKPAVSRNKRWGILLGGGEGVRLRTLTRFISGDDRPKQFCRMLGPQTLFEEAMARSARSVPPEQTVVALTTAHERYYHQHLQSSPARKLLQPENRGTAPAILLSLFHIVEQEPDAIVVTLPCDHFYSNEAAFSSVLESAFHAAESESDGAVLIGAHPAGPEVEFGWIQIGAGKGKNLFQVRGFEEKPSFALAERLFREGALWNTFVMVGRATTFLWMSLLAIPEVYLRVQEASLCFDEDRDLHVPSSLYSAIPSVDFSRRVLSHQSFRLLVMPLAGSEWQDLGHIERVLSVVHSNPIAPVWAEAWDAALCRLNHGRGSIGIRNRGLRRS